MDARQIPGHVLLPALAPLAIVGLYFTPVSAIGCANRGLAAITVAFVAAIAAFVTIGIAFRERHRGSADAAPWILSTAILALALAALIALA